MVYILILDLTDPNGKIFIMRIWQNNSILKWIIFLPFQIIAIIEEMALRAQLRMHIAVWVTTY